MKWNRIFFYCEKNAITIEEEEKEEEKEEEEKKKSHKIEIRRKIFQFHDFYCKMQENKKK